MSGGHAQLEKLQGQLTQEQDKEYSFRAEQADTAMEL